MNHDLQSNPSDPTDSADSPQPDSATQPFPTTGPAPLATEADSVQDHAPGSPSRSIPGQIWRAVVWTWKTALGALLTQSLLGGVLVVGWIMRAMRRAALNRWWTASRHAQQGTGFEDWLRLRQPDHEHVHWPNWFLAQNARRTWKSRADESRAATWGRRIRIPLQSLWRNLVLGVQGLFNTAVLTLPGCVLMLFSWYDGWNNSFNKGYEQAPVGPLTGLLGIALFILAMLYVPMAQARQAVTGRWRSFYDFHLIWGLVRRHRVACLALAIGYSLLWIPLNALKTAPYFFAHNNRVIENFTPAQALAFLNNFYFWCGFAVLAFVVVLRLWAARLYASKLLNDLQRGVVPVAALAESERAQLLELDLIQVTPPRSRHVLLQVAAKTTSGIWGLGILFLTGLVWFTFVAQIYIAEFLHYHPGVAWLNQPLVQLPWFRYIPAHIQSPWSELFLSLLVLALAFGLAGLAGRCRKFFNRPARVGAC